MAKVITNKQHYTDIANRVRELTGDTDTYTPEELPAVIENLSFSIGGEEYISNEFTELISTNITMIAPYKFYYHTTLQLVDLSVCTEIYNGSFSGCESLNKFIIRTPSVCALKTTGALEGSGIDLGTGYVYVPDDLVDSYKAANNWSTYSSQIRPISEL